MRHANILQHRLVVVGKVVRPLKHLPARRLGRTLERGLQLGRELGRRFLAGRLDAVRVARRRARHLERGGEELDELVELGQPRLQVRVARHFELHADAEAVHAVRVVHRPHREQVLEELARLAVVCDLDVAVDAAAQRVLDDGDGLRLGARPLQEAAVAALRLVPLVPRHAAKLVVDEEHRVARHRHVRDDDAGGQRARHAGKRVDPARHVGRHLVLRPDEAVGEAHLVRRAPEQLLDQREARLGLDELGEGLGKARQPR